MIDGINYSAEISGVDRITVNGKVYLAVDKVFEIIDDVYAMWCYDRIDTVGEAIIVLNKKALALKEGEQE